MKHILAAVVVGLGLGSSFAQADMIEVRKAGAGAGFETASGAADGVNVLFQVDANPVYEAAGYPILSTSVVGRITAKVAVSLNGQVVPYLDIDFTMLGVGFPILGVRYGSGEVTRDIRVDNAGSFRISAIGFWLNGARATDYGLNNGDIGLYVNIAADALGYKLAAHVADGHGVFNGFNAASLELETGLMAKFSKGFKARVSIGGQGDFSIGGNVDSGSVSLRSDANFYGQVSADIAEFVRIYVRGGFNLSLDSGVDADASSRQLMAGAEFRFQ